VGPRSIERILIWSFSFSDIQTAANPEKMSQNINQTKNHDKTRTIE